MKASVLVKIYEAGIAVSKARTEALLRSAQGSGAAEPDHPVVQQALSQKGQGQPLPASLLHQMNEQLEADFGGVRVHADDAATQAAQALRANAFTAGQDVYFGRDKFHPETNAGRQLLAHELAHVVQGMEGRVGTVRLSATGISQANDPLESEAEAAGRSVATPAPVGQGVDGHPQQSPGGQQDRGQTPEAPTGLLGLTRQKLNAAFEDLKYVARVATRKPGLPPKESAEPEIPSTRPRQRVSVDVKVDAELLKERNPDLEKDLSIRFFQEAFKLYHVPDLSYLMAERIYFESRWHVKVSPQKLRSLVQGALASPSHKLPYSSNDLAEALRVYYRIRARDAWNLAEFLDAVHHEKYAEQALLDFYIAQFNAVVGLLNFIIDLPVAPINLKRKIGGGKEIHTFIRPIPKLRYVGEYGQKHGQTMELGATLGLMLVSGGALGEAAGTSFQWIAAQAGQLGRLGSLLVGTVKTVVLAGAVSQVGIGAHDAGEAAAKLKTGVIIEEDGTARPLTEDDAFGLLTQILLSALVVVPLVKGGVKYARDRKARKKEAAGPAPQQEEGLRDPLDDTPYPKHPTSRPLQPNTPAGEYVYVVDKDEVVHIAQNGPHMHPRVLGGGQKARGAGTLIIDDQGVVTEVSNASGTFQFGDGTLDMVQRAIRKQGVPISPNPNLVRIPWEPTTR